MTSKNGKIAFFTRYDNASIFVFLNKESIRNKNKKKKNQKYSSKISKIKINIVGKVCNTFLIRNSIRNGFLQNYTREYKSTCRTSPLSVPRKMLLSEGFIKQQVNGRSPDICKSLTI